MAAAGQAGQRQAVMHAIPSYKHFVDVIIAQAEEGRVSTERIAG